MEDILRLITKTHLCFANFLRYKIIKFAIESSCYIYYYMTFSKKKEANLKYMKCDKTKTIIGNCPDVMTHL